MSNKTDFFNSLRKNAEREFVPIDILFELTGRCNFNCEMCYVHTLDTIKALHEELDTDTWIELFDMAISAGMLFATLSGGECLLRRDFEDLYLHLYTHGVRIRINTNGFLLNEQRINFLKAYRPEAIQISLYGTNDEEYKLSTGTPAFSVIQKNLLQLKEAGIHVNIAITPSEQSKLFVNKLIDFAVDNKYSVRLTELYLPRRDDNADNDSNNRLSVADINSYAKYYAEKNGRTLTAVPLNSLPEPGKNGEDIPLKMHCTAGKNRAQIDWRGVMHPCVALQGISYPILSGSYLDGWKHICDEMAKIQFPSKCNSCYYKNVCTPCTAFRSDPPGSTKCNDLACKLIRMKTACGLLKPERRNAE